jgi:energy-coupling factor transporter ATP-binding protein EcfA2
LINIIIENIRTLSGRHIIPIKPLTILTGENSSGKSSFLASLATICDPEAYPFRPGFNVPPYNLGNYETIATYRGGRAGRAKSFTLGYSLPQKSSRREMATHVEATYKSSEGEPVLSQLLAEAPAGRVALDLRAPSSGRFTGTINIQHQGIEMSREIRLPRVESGARREFSLADLVFRAMHELEAENRDQTLKIYRALSEIVWRLSPIRATSIAPIRTRPERTYGQVVGTSQPTGDHVPFVFERLTREQAGSRETKALLEALSAYGAESGLFQSIKVRKLGRSAGDPFQLVVKVGGRAANLVDVGYGVSQALPVVIETVLAPAESMLLLQQPEVHLHPRAQAALGSFFAQIVSKASKTLVIETHSDYIIDRVRQEVAAGNISRDDVGILFFARTESETDVWEIAVDEHGNVDGAPPNYREFFLEEELRLLTRTASE